MAIETTLNFYPYFPGNIDSRLGPYSSSAHATGSIDLIYRYPGMTVFVSSSTETEEYWWRDGTTNSDLILKPTGTEGTFLTTASNVNNGNILTISKSDGSGYQITIDTGSNFVSYNFTASFNNQSTWEVKHNLGYRYVIIQTFDNDGNQIIPSEITLTNTNTASATFPEQTSGTAVVTFGGATFNNPTLPAGVSNTVQYNDGGVFGGNSYFTFNGTSLTLYDPTGNYLAFSTGQSNYYTYTNHPQYRDIRTNIQDNLIANKIFTGDILEADYISATAFDLVYLDSSDNYWRPVDQGDPTKSPQLLGIFLDNSRVLIDGYIIVGDNSGSPTGVPTITGTLGSGKAVYIKDNATSAPFLSTAAPTTTGGIVRILGHLIRNYNTDYWLMRFRPDHTWVEIV